MITPCAGNHHLSRLNPLAIRGMSVPTGRNANVASPPHIAWATRTLRLEAPVTSASDDGGIELPEESDPVAFIGWEAVDHAVARSSWSVPE